MIILWLPASEVRLRFVVVWFHLTTALERTQLYLYLRCTTQWCRHTCPLACFTTMCTLISLTLTVHLKHPVFSGAESIGLHMVSPVSRGLFHRVVLQSGAPLMSYTAATSRTSRQSNRLVRAVCVGDVTETSRLIDCLQNVPSSHILVSSA